MKEELKAKMKRIAEKIAEMEGKRNLMKFGHSTEYVSLRELIGLKKEFYQLQKKYEKTICLA